ncbi:MAG TPA: hypothetical protein DEG17_05110 [Cyanobacteria bacterium UBA11149]|nr:hypothetical protein [Cyanobacteria bacterium UBA11367]HBE59238.1 hypothetical protein [Cyanobacteria bacterium UBA11366]HBK62936.1 hypothetical protein [Cyanobacteria bacterium UBA11166]HBR76872.1 hypothetical protein [Cyanobacteria bacterium UBA11159]HBS69129.1 hypothetical protein [Cyanobacteria bacterium UBA11153]HBW88264.1 hypothetical protein [Cyanobacteria bacterium UBA11149]HCA97127.1 hypothetical protein [Cyanobacteria bacterium UBA9226]
MSTLPQLNLYFSKVLQNGKSRNSSFKKYRRFNWWLIAAALIPTVGVGLFNIIIDPYDVFDTPNFLGVNHSKPDKDNTDRLFKALDIIRIKPITIFIGSSRTKQGLDPTHPALASHQPAYNLALNGPNTYEIRRYLEHAIANQPNLKEVIFGVDFFMFNSSLKNQPSFSENRLEKRHLTIEDVITSTFSWDAYSKSVEAIKASLKEPNKNDDYGKNGFMPNRNLENGENEWRFKSGITLYFSLHSDYQFSNQYLSDFKKIVELCQKHGITLKVFISPSHAIDLEAIRATGRWEVFEQWQREIVKITPVLDFSGYNSITTEPISNYMKNYVDNSHYSQAIGNLVLNRILNYQQETVPQDFGIFLTPDNIESHIERLRNDREVWAKNNPNKLKFVEELKREYDRKRTLEQKK